ncbi:MAG: bifunctional riboflavin kinase/FAD synthetase [Bacilli bacterium]|jgi:riboflavin kinase/FMN adenylyltransferase|nr:bifunctional riboflavin kinase/FAD synthetase [Bacilli bacterium]
MELIYFDYHEQYAAGSLVLAIGEFDGMHLAHKQLITRTIEISKDMNVKSAVLTFDPHPDFILRRKDYSGYLTPLSEKIKILQDLGIDILIIVPFTKPLSQLKHVAFEKQILQKFSILHLVVGFDFRYGHKGKGNVETLSHLFPITIIPKMEISKQKIGSNLIRDYLQSGELKKANEMLGRYFNIQGKVEVGNQVGQRIGIRTANITLKEEYQLLKKGVYAVFVYLNNIRYFGVCNIGNNPTLNYVKKTRLEVHILDFDAIIYNQIISVDFVAFLREEVKFASANELITQINDDIKQTKELLGEIPC